jgi:hypothetical protein
MEIMRLVARMAQDADVQQAGYQAHPLYVLMNIAVPLALGMFVSFGRRAAEHITENGGHKGSAEADE